MTSGSVYDTLLGKASEVVQRELDQLDAALSAVTDNALEWLVTQLAPSGPITREPSVSLVYKVAWAFAEADPERYGDVLADVLDWTETNALRPNGDIYLPEEPEEERDGTRGYRMSTLLRAAAKSQHSLARDAGLRKRIRQYCDPDTGAVASFIGDNPDSPTQPTEYNLGDVCFFGEYALSDHDFEAARSAGRWLLELIRQNDQHLQEGRFYCGRTADGELDTEFPPGADFGRVVSFDRVNQAGWVIGCAAAFLTDLADSDGHASADEYLNAAVRLMEFEDQMPLETYFYPSKCKVAWGAGRLLEYLSDSDQLPMETADLLYRIGRRTFQYTMLGTMKADGTWGDLFYPITTDGPEVNYDYRRLAGYTALPDARGYHSDTAYVLPGIEITGEFIAELLYLQRGVRALQRTLSGERRQHSPLHVHAIGQRT